MAGFEARGAQDGRRRLRGTKRLRRASAAAFALLLCGAAIAQADTGTIGAIGLNDIRSDGILLPNASWNGAADLTLAANAGVTLYRARIQLNCVDPGDTGSFDFTNPSAACYGLGYDQLVGGLADRGMTLLPVLFDLNKSGVPVPPTQGGANGSPTISEFAAFAAAAVRRYGPNGSFWPTCGCTPEPIQAWEIWNEENNGWWWGGHASAKHYGAVLAATRTAIRSVDSQARIILGGLTFDPNGQSSFIAPRHFIKAIAKRNANAFDAVAVHPYTDAQHATPQELASSALAYVNKVARAVKQATGPSATGGPRQQIWITEMGWSTTDASASTIAQGLQDFLVDANAARTADNIGPILYYALRDNSTIHSRIDGLGLRYTTNNGADAGPTRGWAVFTSAAQQDGQIPLPPALPTASTRVTGHHRAAACNTRSQRHAKLLQTCRRITRTHKHG